MATLLLAASPAAAQNFTVASVTTGDFGNIVSATSGTTTFRGSASTGTVTRTAGSGVRLSSGSVRSLVTISCGNQGNCNSNNALVTITTSGTPTGRALSLQNFTISTAGATATIVLAPGSGNSISFRLGPIGRNQSKTFWVGYDYRVADNASAASTGTANAMFLVTASRINGNAPDQLAGTTTGRVFRPIDITATQALSFGRVARPRTGSGTISLSSAGAVSTTGDGTAAIGTARATAGFSVAGEGGQSVTVSVPGTIALSGPGGTISMTTLPSASGAQVLSGAAGGAGSLNLTVGGTLPLTSSTSPGLYSGTLSVTVQYN